MTLPADRPTNADYLAALNAVIDAKRARLLELQNAGRYGYQLRAPRTALRKAFRALDGANEAHGLAADPTAPLLDVLVPSYRAALKVARTTAGAIS